MRPYSNTHTPAYYPVENSPASMSSWGTVHMPPAPFNQYPPANVIIGVDISREIRSQLKPRDLSEQAFSPALSNITLWVGPTRKWSLLIQNAFGITVQDLLAGIYGLYYKPLDANDVHTIRHDIIANARYWAGLGAEGRLRRIDLLCGHTRIDKIQFNQDYTECHVTMI
ncbi:hypothetical protein P691DRAFT_704306 [Macrolepiota fuliginosa MF-IS2]|uniref:DUF6699 domain-containing protein n=1 Tax=Macrolepiota fuliginosa MF-IS2 TaxID=1400762 RepID=A0A9P5XER2_9AGAR|nr:hypothetical protein P691DRAFT_704306 [Macrolepiota fuliginosa MF-IS2]